MAVLLIPRSFLCMVAASRSYNVPDMNVDLRYLQNCLIANRLTQNVLKTEYIYIYVGRRSRQRIATVTQGQEFDLLINGISF